MLINRFYHKPQLHVPSQKTEKKPNWLELFYDLIYVAAIIQLGNGLSTHISLVGFLTFATLFYFLWQNWCAFTFYHNRYNIDDALQRLVVFIQMFAIGGMAVSVSGVFDGKHHIFISCLVVSRLILVFKHARAWLSVDAAKRSERQFTLIWSIGACLWFLSLFIPSPWTYIFWLLAAAVDFSAPFTEKSVELNANYPVDGAHLTERFGLLTIIVLGEMFVKVLTEVSDKGANVNMLITASLGLGITCSLWWLYFDDIAGSRIKKGALATYAWIYLHLPLMLGITAVGVAIKKAVFFQPGIVAPIKYRVFLCGSLFLALVSMALIDLVSERTHALLKDVQRARARFAGALLVALLAFAGGAMPAVAFLVLIVSACVAQVLFDVGMAPKRFVKELSHSYHLFGEQGKTDDLVDINRSEHPRRKSFETAVRMGTPDSFRSDLYVHLVEGSWKQLIGLAAGLYLFINLVFAALYLLDPAGISKAGSLSFFESFAFSIQTFTTIGYGSMYPTTTFAHVLVTLEAFIGLLWVAMTTGVVFAKAARSKANVLFSEVGVIKMHEGRRTFMVRIVNARGSLIGDAKVSMNALIETVTAEGENFRRLLEMELLRSHNPIFPLSWTLFHTIDQYSPLCGVESSNIHEKIVFITLSFSGHDEAYSNAVYKTHIYHPDSILFDRQFVSVMHQDPGEEIVLNLSLFHDTEPLPDPGD